MQHRYDEYFTTYSRNLPLLDQKEFSQLANTTMTEGTALRCAVCAIVCIGRAHSIQPDASTLPPDAAQQFYESSKYMLESAERNDSAIRILQTTLLLILYELMMADFSKAWTTMSRAHWLADSMQLSKLYKEPWPSDTTPNETALAYRAVVVLNTFFSIGMSSSLVLSGQFVSLLFIQEASLIMLMFARSTRLFLWWIVHKTSGKTSQALTISPVLGWVIIISRRLSYFYAIVLFLIYVRSIQPTYTTPNIKPLDFNSTSLRKTSDISLTYPRSMLFELVKKISQVTLTSS